jgi:hypothetical protein
VEQMEPQPLKASTVDRVNQIVDLLGTYSER